MIYNILYSMMNIDIEDSISPKNKKNTIDSQDINTKLQQVFGFILMIGILIMEN